MALDTSKRPKQAHCVCKFCGNDTLGRLGYCFFIKKYIRTGHKTPACGCIFHRFVPLQLIDDAVFCNSDTSSRLQLRTCSCQVRFLSQSVEPRQCILLIVYLKNRPSLSSVTKSVMPPQALHLQDA